MRYVKIAFLSDPPVVGFMEVDANGSLVRLTYADGATVLPQSQPAQAYSVINADPPFPAWGVADPVPASTLDRMRALADAGQFTPAELEEWLARQVQPAPTLIDDRLVELGVTSHDVSAFLQAQR